MISDSEILIQTKNLLLRPGAWTQRVSARNKRGYIVPYDSPDAVCWCLSGAVQRITTLLGCPPYGAYDALSKAMHDPRITRIAVPWATIVVPFNDTSKTGLWGVLALLNVAIEIAKGRELASEEKQEEVEAGRTS